MLKRKLSDPSQSIGSCRHQTIDIIADVLFCRCFHLPEDWVSPLAATQDLPGNQDLSPGLFQVEGELISGAIRVQDLYIVAYIVKVCTCQKGSEVFSVKVFRSY